MTAYSSDPKLEVIANLVPKEEGTYKFVNKNRSRFKAEPYGSALGRKG